MSEFARAAFALGYAEHGIFPMPERAHLTCQVVEAIGQSSVAHLIVEAGRKEGHRAKREASHKKLYDYHSADLGAALGVILKRIDHKVLVPQLLEHAAVLAAAGRSAVERRRSVAGMAAVAIAAKVGHQDRLELDTLNATGWAHANAYGIAEAQSTPAQGGPPDSAKVAAAAIVAMKFTAAGDANATSIAWTDLELNTIAMGAALAAGDGAELGDRARAVANALVDTTRATRAYADQLHATVNQAFVAHMTSLTSGALFNWVVNSGDPCEDCTENESESPYETSDLPAGPPLHPNCLCNIELASAQAAHVRALVGATTT